MSPRKKSNQKIMFLKPSQAANIVHSVLRNVQNQHSQVDQFPQAAPLVPNGSLVAIEVTNGETVNLNDNNVTTFNLSMISNNSNEIPAQANKINEAMSLLEDSDLTPENILELMDSIEPCTLENMPCNDPNPKNYPVVDETVMQVDSDEIQFLFPNSSTNLEDDIQTEANDPSSTSPSVLNNASPGNFAISVEGSSSIPLQLGFPLQVIDDPCLDEGDINNHNINEGRKRRHKADPSEWKRNKNKMLRMKGKAYLGYSRKRNQPVKQDKFRPPKVLKSTCDSIVCRRSKKRNCSDFTENQRQGIFNKFWELTWDQRKVFVSAHVAREPTKRKTAEGTSRRSHTLVYSLSNGEVTKDVCRKMFLNTLGLNYRMVQNWVKDNSFNMPTQNQSNSNSERQTVSTRMAHLRNFISSLPKLPSHYGRRDSSKLYLEPHFRTITDVYNLYKNKCSESNTNPLSRTAFAKELNEENISVYQLKKDKCNTCCSYEAGILPETEWKIHVERKKRARVEKEIDIKLAKEGKQITLEMDFQAVKLAPFTNANAFYYKTKLCCHNSSIYNAATKQCTCYWFSEDQNNSLVASTFVSCVIDYLQRYCVTPEKLPIILYSDGCTAQNRNNVLANALLEFSIQNQIQVQQKYLEVGHTQMEVDSVHACIERKLKNREIKLPSDYISITREARQNPTPYEAVACCNNFFKEYNFQLRYNSIRPGKKKDDPVVNDIKTIFYDPEGQIKVKLDYDKDWVNLPARPKKINLPIEYPPLFTEPCKITKSKWNHLQELKSVLPADTHLFYDNLPYQN